MSKNDMIKNADLSQAISLIKSGSVMTCDEFIKYLQGTPTFDFVVSDWMRKNSNNLTYEVNSAIINYILEGGSVRIESFSEDLLRFNDQIYTKDFDRLIKELEYKYLYRELSQIICSGINLQSRIKLYYKHEQKFAAIELARIWINVQELRNNVLINVIINNNIEKFCEKLNTTRMHEYNKTPLNIEEIYNKSNLSDDVRLGVVL